MDNIRKFDEEFKHIYSNVFLWNKIGIGILCSIGLLFMLFPFGLSRIGCIFCSLGVTEYLRTYQVIREGNVVVSIYEKLSYMPVSKNDIRKVRREYLNHFCIRLGLAAFILQVTASLFNHNFGITSILFSFVWSIVIWIVGLIYLYL